MKKSTNFLILAILVVGLVVVVYAQKTDLSGTWVGFAERLGNQDNIIVVLEKKDDTYIGKLTDEMGEFPGAEAKNLTVNNDVVAFELDGGQGDQSYTVKIEMKLSEDSLKGTWVMVGSDTESGMIELNRKK